MLQAWLDPCGGLRARLWSEVARTAARVPLQGTGLGRQDSSYALPVPERWPLHPQNTTVMDNAQPVRFITH